jgi:hypothetical protein
MQNRTFGSYLMVNNRIFISAMIIVAGYRVAVEGALIQATPPSRATRWLLEGATEQSSLKTNRTQLVLFGMQNRAFGPYLMTKYGIHIPVMALIQAVSLSLAHQLSAWDVYLRSERDAPAAPARCSLPIRHAEWGIWTLFDDQE